MPCLGPVWSSYAVQEKQQVAEIDPSMVVDDSELFDGPLGPPCLICEEIGDDETLLLCDGCEAACHVECASLPRIPRGPWYCHLCQEDDRVRIPETHSSRPTETPRTRASQRRSRRNAHDPWARVWQSVWHRINLDLDFPFDEDDGPTQRQTEAERREFLEYQRRYEVAARQGGAQRFRAIAPTLLERTLGRPKPEEPSEESQEELRAWNAFEKARQLSDNPQPSNRRKRKSTTNSPAEPEPEPEQRKFKRPRAKRAPEPAGLLNNSLAESSRAARNRGQTSQNPRVDADRATVGSNFLQSLLREVENAHSPTAQPHTVGSPLPTSESHHSPRPSSPDSSPPSSIAGTPRAMSTTPPPEKLARRNSFTPLTSTILPVFPTVPQYSPFSPVRGSYENVPPSDEVWSSRSRRRHRNGHASSDSSPPPSKDTSPTRKHLSYSAKQEVQKMVASVLKPRYRKGELSRDHFTDINRDVSRMMYDMIGDADALSEEKDRKYWQGVAAEEVEKALRALNDTEGKGLEVNGTEGKTAASS